MNELSKIFEAQFTSAIASNRLHHAYLLIGDTERLLLDRVFQLLCQRHIQHQEGAICKDCDAIKRRVHPELFWADEDSRSLKIDTIRDAIAFASLGAAEDKYRVIVLPNIERLALPAANALLKTLEEPPKRVVFLLTAKSSRHLLMTLASRCQKVRLSAERSAENEPAYNAFKRIFLQQSDQIDVIAAIDGLQLSGIQLIDCFTLCVVDAVKQRLSVEQNCDSLFAFYKKILHKKSDFLKVSSLNASLLGYHLACEWLALSRT